MKRMEIEIEESQIWMKRNYMQKLQFMQMKKSSSLDYRNNYFMVVSFKIVLTIVASVFNFILLKNNSKMAYNSETDLADCRDFTSTERLYVGLQIVQAVLRIVDIISLFAVIAYYIETKNEAKKAEDAEYNNDRASKFGAEENSSFL
jgi:hypothetical protein